MKPQSEGLSFGDTPFRKTEAWEPYWNGMPEFVQEDQKPLWSLDVNLRSDADLARFEELAGRIYHGKWMWYPPKGYGSYRGQRWVAPADVQPRYPVYIPSKGRWETPFTIRTFEALGVPFYVVVEPQDAEAYARAVKDPSRILILPHQNKGLVATRNWIWDHAAAGGTKRFWTFDDNIQGLYRLNRNAKIQPTSGVFLRAIEDWADRYENVPLAGMQYESFAMRRDKHPALALNARVYSNMLLETDYREDDGRPFRNDPALKYNDDTDLNLRIMKRGHVTALFYAFLANKIATMVVKGGMDYKRSAVKEEDDRWIASNQLHEKHPDVATVVWKWDRWHHQVDYSSFEKNEPRPVPGLVIPEGPNEYGMELKTVEGAAPDPEEPRPARKAPVPMHDFGDRPVGPVPSVQMGMTRTLSEQPVPAGWRPDEPPDLRAMGVKEVALDFETTGLRWFAGDRPVGIAVGWDAGAGRVETRYLPFGHRDGNLDEGAVRRWANEQLSGLSIKNLNTKFDAHFSQEWGADLDALGCRLGDVAHYAALLDDHRGEGWRRRETPFSLQAIGLDYAGEGKLDGALDVSRMAEYHSHSATAYARQDVRLVILAMRAQRPLLESQDLLRVAKLEDDIIPVVVEMERNAARMDVEKLRRWERDSAEALLRIRTELVNDVGWDINPDSPDHMARLFSQLGLASNKYTDTGRESYDSSVLEGLVSNPLIAKVVRVSRLADLRSKFLVPYNEAVGDDGLLRFEFHQLKGDQYGTVSGRFSSTKPAGARKGANVQQVYSVDNQLRRICQSCGPEWGARSAKAQVALHYAEHPEAYVLRELFIPDDGLVTAASDAKQIEYRIFAHLTGSARLLKAYGDDPNVDFHEWTGEIVRKFRPDFERKRLKIVNFSNLFGAGSAKQAEMLGISEAEGEELQRVYFTAFPEARTLMDMAMDVAKRRGYVKTILGRRARFPSGKRLHAALNRAVSGGAADVNKLKLIALYRMRKELGIKMRMTVHDEVVADIQRDALPALAAAMDVQEAALKVPILWDTKCGANWGAAK